MRRPYDSFLAESIFLHLDAELNRPDCKTARHIVAKERVIFALRHDAGSNPLNIRIAERKRPWKGAALIALTACIGALWLTSFLSDVYRTSAARAQEGTVRTITAPSLASPENHYYPPTEQ